MEEPLGDPYHFLATDIWQWSAAQNGYTIVPRPSDRVEQASQSGTRAVTRPCCSVDMPHDVPS